MPRGSALLLGRVLLMYWHKMTRMVRDLLYISVGDIEEEVIIATHVLSRDQLSVRKYFRATGPVEKKAAKNQNILRFGFPSHQLSRPLQIRLMFLFCFLPMEHSYGQSSPSLVGSTTVYNV